MYRVYYRLPWWSFILLYNPRAWRYCWSSPNVYEAVDQANAIEEKGYWSKVERKEKITVEDFNSAFF